MEKELPGYYSGTSGLLLPVRNKLFYPEEFKDKSRLCFYASMINSIEINSSFYKVPMAATVAKWAKDVPEGFRFTFKFSKDITHQKGLSFDPESVKHFFKVIDQVSEKRGCLLVQFPPSVRIGQIKQLGFLMAVLRECDPRKHWNIALEFRHISLYNDEIYRMLKVYDMGMVIQDMPKAVTPVLDSELPFVYLRFHGPDGSYRGTYADDFLYEYAGYINDWLAEGKTVYTYFNNTMGSALANLFTLKDFVIRYNT
ncbi:MAG: DUF72 domain-containing protein [Pedobacter sp.]|uniref:DUF72 domain-containing protein n=1 Tax=Pedobacter sp. TaxID=1411316 RepID=UPI003563BA24